MYASLRFPYQELAEPVTTGTEGASGPGSLNMAWLPVYPSQIIFIDVMGADGMVAGLEQT